MEKIFRSKSIAYFTILSLILFLTPLIQAETPTGNLIGFIYAQDGTTPVTDAVFKLKNIKTDKTYESLKTDSLCVFKVEGIEEGMYVAAVTTAEGNFNLPNIIGVKAETTAKLSLALKKGVAAQGDDDRDGGFLNFLGSPLGIATILAVTGLLIYGIIKLTEEEEEASPFKK